MPHAKLIIAGDINQLEIKTLLNYHSINQIVKIPTRAQKILDVFVTNVTGLVRSDHLAVLVKPTVKKKDIKKPVEFCDVRQHNRLRMLQRIEEVQWNLPKQNDNGFL